MTSVADLLRVRCTADAAAPALGDSTGVAWSYGDLDRAARALSDLLVQRGLRAGDRVLVVAENCAAAVAALFAIWQAGAVAVPVNARQSPPEIDRITAHADPRAIVLTGAVSPEAARHAVRLGADAVAGPWGTVDLVMRDDPGAPCAAQTAVILYTTGTTGDPKGVMLSHENVRFGGATSAQLRGMTPDDLIYGVLPITHVFGLCSVVVAAVHAGAPVRLVPRFDPGAVLAGLQDDITLFSAVPQMHALLMAQARAQGRATLGSDRLRYVSSGAAPLDPAWKRAAEAFYGVALQNGYGMTETTAGTSATRNAIGDPDTSVGPPLPGIAVDIDQTVTGGGAGLGEVRTRGPHVMQGYFRAADRTAAILDDAGWLRTGDLGRIDAAGRLHIVGRSKELIIHGGFNVFPPEVEAALNDHPGVVQAAVVGRWMDGDEQVLAFVQVPTGSALTVDALRRFVADRLAGYKRPAHYVLATSLPAAPTGKILKHRLIETFRDDLP